MSGKEAAVVKKDKKHNLMRDIKIDKLVLNCCVGKITSVAYTIILPYFYKLLIISSNNEVKNLYNHRRKWR